MNNAYEGLITTALAVAAEAKIRANGDREIAMPGWPSLDRLANCLYRAVADATHGLLTDEQLDRLGLDADVIAIGVIAAEQDGTPSDPEQAA